MGAKATPSMPAHGQPIQSRMNGRDVTPRLGGFSYLFSHELVPIPSLAQGRPGPLLREQPDNKAMPREEKGHCQADFPEPPSHIHIWLAASSLSGWHQVPDTLSRAKTTNLCLPPHASKYFHNPTVPPDSETSLPWLHWLPSPILRAPRTPRGTPAEWAPPPNRLPLVGVGPRADSPQTTGRLR